jgi:hypothetical protein
MQAHEQAVPGALVCRAACPGYLLLYGYRCCCIYCSTRIHLQLLLHLLLYTSPHNPHPAHTRCCSMLLYPAVRIKRLLLLYGQNSSNKGT